MRCSPASAVWVPGVYPPSPRSPALSSSGLSLLLPLRLEFLARYPATTQPASGSGGGSSGDSVSSPGSRQETAQVGCHHVSCLSPFHLPAISPAFHFYTNHLQPHNHAAETRSQGRACRVYFKIRRPRAVVKAGVGGQYLGRYLAFLERDIKVWL